MNGQQQRSSSVGAFSIQVGPALPQPSDELWLMGQRCPMDCAVARPVAGFEQFRSVGEDLRELVGVVRADRLGHGVEVRRVAEALRHFEVSSSTISARPRSCATSSRLAQASAP